MMSRKIPESDNPLHSDVGLNHDFVAADVALKNKGLRKKC